MGKPKNYIQTYTKRLFDPLNICRKDIVIEDIAHSLSMTVRANGHIKHFYSVAQHSIDCFNEAKARRCTTRVQLACLLHDASECYIADIPRPVKHRLNGYAQIEKKISKAVYAAFGIADLSEKELHIVDEIDDALLYYEFLHLAGLALYKCAPKIAGRHSFDYQDLHYVKSKFIDIYGSLKNSLNI